MFSPTLPRRLSTPFGTEILPRAFRHTILSEMLIRASMYFFVIIFYSTEDKSNILRLVVRTTDVLFDKVLVLVAGQTREECKCHKSLCKARRSLRMAGPSPETSDLILSGTPGYEKSLPCVELGYFIGCSPILFLAV